MAGNKAGKKRMRPGLGLSSKKAWTQRMSTLKIREKKPSFGIRSSRTRRGGMSMKNTKRTSRRQLLKMGAAAMGGGLLAQQEALAIETPGKLGIPLGPYGERSPFEKAVRWRRDTKTPETGSSFTPLQDSVGTLTPSSLHYERHHAGIPPIDPARHRLVIYGMEDRPLSISLAEIRRPPSVTPTLGLEGGGDSRHEALGARPC